MALKDENLWGVETREATPKKRSATVNVQNVKHLVPMRDLLERYGADVRGIESHGMGWVSIKCPFHGTDNRPSASLHNVQQRFRCHQCDIAGDVIDVVAAVEGLDVSGALRWLSQNF